MPIVRHTLSMVSNGLEFSWFKITKKNFFTGFLVWRWNSRWLEGLKQMAAWIQEGKIKYEETVTEGFENMPTAFIEMLRGENTGKAVIKV